MKSSKIGELLQPILQKNRRCKRKEFIVKIYADFFLVLASINGF
nr:MAG TPA: hypothetical protein [Caudoviricetes sp.]